MPARKTTPSPRSKCRTSPRPKSGATPRPAAKSRVVTPAAYIASVPEPQQTDLRQLDALIRSTVPDLKPFMLGGMLGYGPYHYKYASGREGDSAIVAVSARKGYLAIYVGCSTVAHCHLEGLKAKLPKANLGKGCIRIKRLADADPAVLQDIFRFAEKSANDAPPGCAR